MADDEEDRAGGAVSEAKAGSKGKKKQKERSIPKPPPVFRIVTRRKREGSRQGKARTVSSKDDTTAVPEAVDEDAIGTRSAGIAVTIGGNDSASKIPPSATLNGIASSPLERDPSSTSSTSARSAHLGDVSDTSYRESYLELANGSTEEVPPSGEGESTGNEEADDVDLGDFSEILSYLSDRRARYQSRLTSRGSRIVTPLENKDVDVDEALTPTGRSEGFGTGEVKAKDFAKAKKRSEGKAKAKAKVQARRTAVVADTAKVDDSAPTDDEPSDKPPQVAKRILKRPDQLSTADTPLDAPSRLETKRLAPDIPHLRRNLAAVGIAKPPQTDHPRSEALRFQPSSVLSPSGHFVPADHDDDTSGPDQAEVYSLPLDDPTKSTSLMAKLSASFPHETAFKSNNIFVSNHHPIPARTTTNSNAAPARASASASAPQPQSVFVFVDLSNILVGFIQYIKLHYPRLDLRAFKRVRSSTHSGSRKIRMDYHSLFAILERGRSVVHRYLAASSPLYQSLDVAVARGYEVQIMERVLRPDPVPAGSTPPNGNLLRPAMKKVGFASTTESESDGPRDIVKPLNRQAFRLREQGLDEIIQLAIVDALDEFDWTEGDDERPRPLLVLASGDANPGEFSKRGFRGRVLNALRDGWDVEILGWRGSISNFYFEEENRRRRSASAGTGGGKLAVLCLDEFAEELLSDEA